MHADVTAAWERAVEQWDDLARHEQVIAMGAQHSAFAWVAGKYKERAGDPIADKQLERIRKAVTAAMMASATPRSDEEKQPYQKVMVWFLVLAGMAVLGLLFAKLSFDNKPTKPNPAPSLVKPPVKPSQGAPTPKRP